MSRVWALILLGVLALAPVALAVVLSRRQVTLSRPAGIRPPAPALIGSFGLSVAEFHRVAAAVERGERPTAARLFPAARELARRQLPEPVPRLARITPAIQAGLGAGAVLVGLLAGSGLVLGYGGLYLSSGCSAWWSRHGRQAAGAPGYVGSSSWTPGKRSLRGCT